MCKPNFPFLEREFLLRNKGKHRTCPGGPVVETPHSQCRGPGSAPGWGTRSCMLELRACMWPQGCGTDQKKEKRERENYQAGLPGAHHTYLWPFVPLSLPSLPPFVSSASADTDLQGPLAGSPGPLDLPRSSSPVHWDWALRVGSLVRGLSPP